MNPLVAVIDLGSQRQGALWTDNLKEAVELCLLSSLGDTDTGARKTQIQMQTVERQDVRSTSPLN